MLGPSIRQDQTASAAANRAAPVLLGAVALDACGVSGISNVESHHGHAGSWIALCMVDRRQR